MRFRHAAQEWTRSGLSWESRTTIPVALDHNVVPSCSPRVPSLWRALPWVSHATPPHHVPGPQRGPVTGEAVPQGRSGDGTHDGVRDPAGMVGGAVSQESARYRSALLGCMTKARWALSIEGQTLCSRWALGHRRTDVFFFKVHEHSDWKESPLRRHTAKALMPDSIG
jgi:hypothetical protein